MMIMPQEEHLSKEEQIIYEIVDEILRSEDRINILNQSLEDEYKGSFNSELLSLKEDKEKYSIQIKDLQNEMTNKLLVNQNDITIKQSDQAKLKSKASQIENNLKHLSLSTKENIYQMSYEKIEEMINSKKSNDDIQMLNQDISTGEGLKKTIEISLNDNKSKQNEIMECLKMMKEEKEVYKEEIINLISQKESIEEIIKYLFQQSSFIGKNYSAINGNDMKSGFKDKEKDIELFSYEIIKADLTKVTTDIHELIFDNHSTLNTIKGKNTKVRNGDSLMIKNHGGNEHIDFGIIIKNEVLNYHKKINCNNSSAKYFCLKLSKEIINHIKGNKMPFEDELLYLDELNDLSEDNRELSQKKIPYLTITDEELLKEDTLCLYIKYIFKISYYEEIIKQRLSFISKDYKTLKKNFNKQVAMIHNIIIKLHAKIDEINLKITETKNRKSFLLKSQKKKHIPELSSDEKEFIKQNDVLTLIKEDIDHIDRDIELIHSQNKDIKREYEIQIQQKKDEEKEIELQIQTMSQEIKKERLALNDEIIELRHQIAQRFTVIKTQLKNYRENNGNNLVLYNRLVESINTTIQSTAKNSPLSKINDKLIVYHTIQAETCVSKYTSRSSHKPRTPKSNSFTITNVNTERDVKDSFLILNIEDLSYHTKQNLTQRKVNKFQSHSPLPSPKPSPLSTITVSDQTALWLKERDKLNKTIKTLKEKISKTENTIDRNTLIKRLKPLNEFIHCYCRYSSNKETKYNPLDDSLQSKSFSFISVSIAIDDSITNILIKKSQDDEIKAIPLSIIDTTIVSKIMKHIIQIYRENRKCQGKPSIDDIIQKEEFASIPMTYAQKKKAAYNKHFNFSIQIKQSQRIEFVFASYEDFKLWLNGLAFIMKNKILINKYRALVK